MTHPGVDKITFTGSGRRGPAHRRALRRAAQAVHPRARRQAAAIILDDADLGTMVPRFVPIGIMINGQTCVAQTRILAPARATTRWSTPWFRACPR